VIAEASETMMRAIRFRTAKAQWYKNVFDAPDGQMVLADLIKFANAHDQSYVAGSPDETAFREGMRRVVTRIEKFIHMTPKQIAHISEMHRETEERYGRAPVEEDYAA